MLTRRGFIRALAGLLVGLLALGRSKGSMIEVHRLGFPRGYDPTAVHTALSNAGYASTPGYGGYGDLRDRWIFKVETTEANRTAVEAIIDGEVNTTSGIPVAVGSTVTGGAMMQGFDYVTQVNTAAEQTVLTTTIKANSMGANGFFRLKVYLLTRNGMAGVKTFTPKVTLGATTIYQPIGTFTNDADATKRGMWEIEITVRNTATNAQIVSQRHNLRDIFAASATGNPPAVNTHSMGHATATIDTTADVTLTMTMTMESADANLAWYLADARLEGPFYSA